MRDSQPKNQIAEKAVPQRISSYRTGIKQGSPSLDHPILQWQRSLGNQQVLQMLRQNTEQNQLNIGRTGERYVACQNQPNLDAGNNPPAQPLPAGPAFPPRGIKVIGPDAQSLAQILSSYTGLTLQVDQNNMLTITGGTNSRANPRSATARRQLVDFINNSKVGVIIDTNPHSEGVIVGARDENNPGYQWIDVANIRVMAAAGGEHAGISDCDAIMHEITEAFALRQAAVGKTKGTFEQAHGEGLRIEEAIRTELGLPLRSQKDQGQVQILGMENSTTYIILESTIYQREKTVYTQLNVIRLVLGPVRTNPNGGTTQSGDDNVAASYVVQGEVRFNSQMEALAVFNKYASNFGFRPIRVPQGNPAPSGQH